MDRTALARRLKTSRPAKVARVPVLAYRNAWVEPDDVMVASYPKSGNTWLRMMLADLVVATGCDSFDTLARVVPELERLKGQPDAHRLADGGRIVKTHETYHRRYRRGVYVVRDCRDVAASYWKHQRRNGRTTDEIEPYCVRFVNGRIDNYGTWARNVDSWLDAAERQPDRYLVVRYEDLLARPVEQLGSIAGFLGIRVATPRVESAIENNSRSRMREKEKASKTIRYGGDRGLSFVSTDDHSSRPALTDDLAQRLMEKFGATMRRAGYPC